MIKQVVATMIVSAVVVTPIASHINAEVSNKQVKDTAQTAIVEVAEVKTATLEEIAQEVIEIEKETETPAPEENTEIEAPTAGTGKTSSKTTSKTSTKTTSTTKTSSKTTTSTKTTSTKTTAKATTPAEVAKEVKKRGNYGRLIIPEAGINVAVFFTKDYSKLQKIVDAKDSACMFNWTKGNKFVADHNNQDFGALRTKKYSKMQIVTPNGVENYKLVEKISNGWNKGSNLTYKDGTSIGAKHQNSMVLYTCNPTKGSVTITVWERVK